jgi:hypothetical protein
MEVGTNVLEETAASIFFYPEDRECRFLQNKDTTEPNNTTSHP